MFTCLFSTTVSTVIDLLDSIIPSVVGGRTLILFLLTCFDGFPGNFERPILFYIYYLHFRDRIIYNQRITHFTSLVSV
jgi:hypothetical protein